MKYYSFISWSALNIETYKGYIEDFVTFDIETTNVTEQITDKKSIHYGFMYIWQACINGHICFGRTWEEYIDFVSDLKNFYGLNNKRKLVIYVHNLAYEFQFIRKFHNVVKMTARKMRVPIRCSTSDGLEFRCSYLLSGYSLDVIGKHLGYAKGKDFDYSLIRNSKTILHPGEIDYCKRDVVILYKFILTEIERNGSLADIPLTKTSYVRRLMKKACFEKPKTYKDLMSDLTIKPLEYKLMKNAFQGGFTHCNAWYQGKTLNDVYSADITSSYPYAMVSEFYPMSKGEKVCIESEEEFVKQSMSYLLITTVKIYDLEPVHAENIISSSKCEIHIDNLSDDYIENNGRIYYAKNGYILTRISSVDFEIYHHYYKWSKIEFGATYRYKKGKLPEPIVNTVLKLYSDKTLLKGQEGYEREYMNAKENTNSTYGMMVTDIAREEIDYVDNEWKVLESVLEETIEKYNTKYDRFLFYAWGVFITAYARRNLLSMLYKITDYIYADTDSLKFMGKENFELFERYNKKVERRLKHMLNPEQLKMALAKDKNGKVHMLGAFEPDGHYDRFKTLGAKRYMYEIKDGDRTKIYTTIAGCEKTGGADYLSSHTDPFEAFGNHLIIPAEYANHMTAYYNDDEMYGEITDYQGHTAKWGELSNVALIPGPYSLSIGVKYAQFLKSFVDAEMY